MPSVSEAALVEATRMPLPFKIPNSIRLTQVMAEALLALSPLRLRADALFKQSSGIGGRCRRVRTFYERTDPSLFFRFRQLIDPS